MWLQVYSEDKYEFQMTYQQLRSLGQVSTSIKGPEEAVSSLVSKVFNEAALTMKFSVWVSEVMILIDGCCKLGTRQVHGSGVIV